MTIFCSTIIATIGRSTLARAVDSVLAQALPAEFEIIVVNDSGQALPVAAWQTDPRVRLIATHRQERCLARNAGAAIARGRYLHILDDDDWLLPGALAALYAAAQAAPAAWHLGGSQLLNRAEQPTIQHRPALAGNVFVEAMAGEWIPLQASLIDAGAFWKVGGFLPDAVYVEDNDLARRFTLIGEIQSVPALIACLALGPANSTTNARLSRENSWSSRENLLADPRCFARLRAGTGGAYGRGRIVRCYATSAWWNVRHGQLIDALRRAASALAALAQAFPYLRTPRFWQAVLRAYDNPTFARGLAERVPAD